MPISLQSITTKLYSSGTWYTLQPGMKNSLFKWHVGSKCWGSFSYIIATYQGWNLWPGRALALNRNFCPWFTGRNQDLTQVPFVGIRETQQRVSNGTSVVHLVWLQAEAWNNTITWQVRLAERLRNSSAVWMQPCSPGEDSFPMPRLSHPTHNFWLLLIMLPEFTKKFDFVNFITASQVFLLHFSLLFARLEKPSFLAVSLD